jgi:WD40 repeat protein
MNNSSSEREQRLNSILAEYLEARRQGKEPGRDELLAKHPEFAVDLAAFLDDQAALARLAPAAQPAAAETVDEHPAGTLAPPPGTRIGYFGDFELLAEIARGGMGVVYRARQLSLNRLVALKMILSGQLASEQEIDRFRAEAEAAAGLDHPNILPIYEVGQYQGHQYFSMKLITGGSLTDPLGRTPRPPLNDLIDVLIKVCRAVHAAHQRGILHRDLKPANILLQSKSESGADVGLRITDLEPYVTDFGLAKRVEGDSQLTQSGAVVGTPSYMPPEQARGSKKLSTAADVYALGAILYEMLTGRPPFRGESHVATLLQVLERDPARPRSLDRRADPDLETICLKCLEKEPGARYLSADALADELQRWRDGLPILARPATTTERVVKWAKRRPAVAGLMAALACVALAGIGGIVWKWQDAVAAEHTAVLRAQAEMKAKDEEKAARIRESDAKVAAQRAQAEERKARVAAQRAQAEEKKAKEAAQKAEKEEAKARAAAVTAQTQAETDRDAKQQALIRVDGLRLAAEADAARFRDPGLALLLAVEGAQRAPSHLTFSSLYGALADCREVLALGDGGREERGWYIYRDEVKLARYFPDGRRILSMAGASLRIHDGVSGKLLREWPGYNLKLSSAALDPEGKRIVLTGHGYSLVRHSDGVTYHYTDRLAYVIDLTTGKELLRLRGSKYTLAGAEFSPDGKRILTASWDGMARVYDAATGKLLLTMKPPNTSKMKEFLGDKSLLLARFAPDGKHIVTITTNDQRVSYGYDGFEKKKPVLDPDFDPEFHPVGPSGSGTGGSSFSFDAESIMGHVWDAETGKQVAQFYKAPPGLLKFGHVWKPTAAGISPDSASVAIALDGVVPVYETKTGKHRFDLTGHAGEIRAVAFSPDRKLIATAGMDKTVRLWDTGTGKETLRLRNHADGVTGVRFDRTGKLLVSWSHDRTARVWETASGIEKAVLRGHGAMIAEADFSTDGKAVLTAGDRTVRVWSLEPLHMPDRRLEGHKGKATFLAYSPDGKLAVTVSPDQTARLWDTATGRLVRVLAEGRNLGEIRMAQFSPDGKRLITAASHRATVTDLKLMTSAAIVWDVATGKDMLALSQLDTGALAAFFSPDGKQILTVGDGYFRIKLGADKTDGKEIPSGIPGVKITIYSGKTADAGRLQLWDAATGKLLSTVPGKKNDGFFSSNDAFIPVFSPDGKRLLSYDENDRTPKILDAVTGKMLTTLRGPAHWGKPQFLFSPDGGRAFFTRGEGIFIYDAGTGAQLAQLQDFPAGAQQLAISSDGKRLVTASGKLAFVWDLPLRKLLATLRGHENDLTTVAISADGSRVLTGSNDQTAALWDAVSGRMLALYRGHTHAVTQVAFRPDGKQVATVSDDGTARLWPADLWSIVLPRRTRELTEPERLRYELPAAPNTKRWPEKVPKFDPPPGTPPPEVFSLPKAPLDPIAEKKAADAVAGLRAAVQKKPADPEPLRRKLIELRRTYPATAPAVEMAWLLEQLPGPLAKLDAAKVPAAERFEGQPKDLVAVLGEHGRRHWAWPHRLAVSPSGKVLATYVAQPMTYLWDAETLAPRGQLRGLLRGFRTDTEELILDCNHRSIELWDVSTTPPRKRATLEPPGASTLSNVSADGRFAVGFANQDWDTVVLWDLGRKPMTRHPLMKLPKTRRYPEASLFFSPNASLAVLGFHHKEVHLFDLRGAAPKPYAVLRFEQAAPREWAFTPDSKRLVAVVDKTLRVWDVTAAEPKVTLELKGFSQPTFAADGRSLWTASSPLCQWDWTAMPPKEMARLTGAGANADHFALTRDGKRLFTLDGIAIRAWDQVGAEWKQRLLPNGHTEGITSIDFSTDDRLLYTADGDGNVRIWDVNDGAWKERHYLPRIGSVFLLAGNGRDLIAGRSRFTVWDVSGAKPRQRTQPAGQSQYGLRGQSLSADGKLLARAISDRSLALFDLSGPAPVQRASLQNQGGDGHGIGSIALSPDGRLLAVTQDRYNRHIYQDPLRLWRITDKGLTPLTIPWLSPYTALFSPDGKTLALTHDGVELWDLTPPVPQVRVRLEQPKKGQTREDVELRFSPSGDRVATWHGRSLRICDTATGKQLHAWDWPGDIGAVALAHDGRHLAVGNANGTIYVVRLGER